MSRDQASATIAVTFSAHGGDPENESRYREAVREHGAQTVDIRPGDDAAGIAGIQALLLSGGGDVQPCRYGALDEGLCEGVEAARDESELALTSAALRAGLPVLGICRGAQVLGVALGGALIQDIASKPANAIPHRGSGVWHDIEVARNGRLFEVVGAAHMRVNSSHHQANSRLGAGVSRAAWCDDGVTEAIEVDGAAFAIGVQWHPERMLESESSRRLFAAFIEAARAASDRKHG